MTNARRADADHAPIRTVGTLPLTSFAAGADIKVIQNMLGHKDAAMTLNVYAGLFPDRLDTIADALDSYRSSALVPAGKQP